MDFRARLLQRIETRSATVGIIGLGYVGLPLAVEFADAGFQVIGIDVDPDKVNQIERGESYIQDVPEQRLSRLVTVGNLTATTDYAALKAADAISICVPTPLLATKDPDLTFVEQAVASVHTILQPGQLVVLESTTYPGTTIEIVQPGLSDNQYAVGEDLFIAFSGERIDPGNKTYGVKNTPKVVGGISPACTELTVALYGTIIERVVPVSSPTAAEMTKLVENTFRAVNIGLANEMALMCDRLGIDVWEVIDAASTKPFGFMPFYPGPGPGGHCIPLDPHYLAWKMKTLNYEARFVSLASQINDAMPHYVIQKVTDALNDQALAVRGSRVVVLGVAYKPDIDDVRESPALHVLELLREKGADVVYHDPHVPSLRLAGGSQLTSCVYTPELLSSADCVLVITNHSAYDWQDVATHSKLVVDTRNALDGYESLTTIVGI